MKLSKIYKRSNQQIYEIIDKQIKGQVFNKIYEKLSSLSYNLLSNQCRLQVNHIVSDRVWEQANIMPRRISRFTY